MKTRLLFTSLITASLLLTGLAGCGSKTSTNPTEAAILAYADPATETTLQGLSEDSLAKYIQYGNADFKAAVTQQILDQIYSQIKDQLGTYVSKSFLKTEEYQGYILVHYSVKFSKSSVGVRMVFDSDHLVAGQFFE